MPLKTTQPPSVLPGGCLLDLELVFNSNQDNSKSWFLR